MSRKMTRAARQAAEKALRAENKKHTAKLFRVPRDLWPGGYTNPPSEVWRSNKYLVQEFSFAGGIRLTVCRAALLPTGDWDDGLTWDELSQIKRECGYQHCWAYECYPPDDQIVNVANMRHLWIPHSAADFGWRRAPAAVSVK